MMTIASMPLLAAGWVPTVLNIFLFLASLWLVLLVLIQRGKGGGLAGAFGGAGGSSPFGSRAGDTFTRLTIYVASLWLFLTMLQVVSIQSAYRDRVRRGGDAVREQ